MIGWMKAAYPSGSSQTDYSVSFPNSFPSISSIFSVQNTVQSSDIAVGSTTENNRGATGKAGLISSYGTTYVKIRHTISGTSYGRIVVIGQYS